MNLSIRKTVALIAAAGFLYFAESTYAQQTQSSIDTSKVYDLGEVIISASRFEESPETVGRNVTVITRREIDGSVQTSVAGILAEQQSLHTVGDRQTPGSNQTAFLRNSNSNHYVVMIDGTRISDPSTNNNGVELSELSLAGVQRIEIVRGSHSTLYGSSAIGGVINIITRGVGREGFNASLNTQHGLLNGNSYSTTNDVAVNFTSGNKFYTNLSVFQQHTSGLDVTIDTVSNENVFNPQDQDGFNKLDLTGKIGYRSTALDLYGAYRRVNQTSDVDQGAYLDDDNAYIEFYRDLFSYVGSYSFSDQLSVSLDGAWSGLKRDFVNDSSVVDARGNYDGTFTETNGEGMLWKNELTTTLDLEHIRMVAGIGYNQQTMNTRTHFFSSKYDLETTTDLDSLNLRERINSTFLHATINGSLFSDRLDDFSLGLGSRLVDHNQFGSHLTYEVNPRVQVTASSLVYGAVTTGFNAPSLYQLHAPAQGTSAYTSLGNDGLEPETSISYEAGWKQTLGNIAQINLSVFRTRVSNVIEYIYLWDGDTEMNNVGFGDYRGHTFLNVSKQDVAGLELNLRAHPRSNLSLGGNLSYTNSTLTFSPDDIDEGYTGGHHVQIYESGIFVNNEETIDGLTRRPSVSASVNVSYSPVDKFSVNITSRFVGNRDDIYYSSTLGPYGALDRSKVRGYNLTDISIKYELNDYVNLGAKAENILNTQYMEINGYHTRGRGMFVKALISL